MIILFCCFWLSYSDLIGIGTLIVTTAIFMLAWVQFERLIKDRRVDFTYKVYMDFFNFLNDQENKDLKNWLFGNNKNEIPKDQYIRLGDLIEKFEAVASLAYTDSLDEQTFYDLISYYVEKVHKATHDPTLSEFIEEYREAETRKGGVEGDTKDIFQDTLYLLKFVEKIRERKTRSGRSDNKLA